MGQNDEGESSNASSKKIIHLVNSDGSSKEMEDSALKNSNSDDPKIDFEHKPIQKTTPLPLKVVHEDVSQDSLNRKHPRKRGFGSSCCGCLATFSLLLKFAWIDYKRKKCLSFIAILSVIMCICVTVIAQSVLKNISVLSYNAIAARRGERDIVVKGVDYSSSFYKYLNGTALTKAVENVVDNKPVYRISFKMAMSKAKANLADPLELGKRGVTFFNGHALNLKEETIVGLGKDNLPRRTYSNIWITKGLANSLGLKTKQLAYVKIELGKAAVLILRDFYVQNQDKFDSNDTILYSETVTVRVRVYVTSKSLISRFNDNAAYKTTALFDIDTMGSLIRNGITENKLFRNWMKEKKTLREVATSAIFQFKNRQEVYKSNYDDVLSTAVKLASDIVGTINAYGINVQMPLIRSLSFTKFVTAAISLMFNLVLSGLLLLGAYVINNIINMTINSKIYFTAIQRTIGLTRLQLVLQTFTYTSGFSIIGLILSGPLIYLSFKFLNTRVLTRVKAGFTLKPEFEAVSLAIFLAFLIPFASAFFPMIKLMFQNVAASLDKDRSKTKSVKVSIDPGSGGFPWTLVMASLFCALFGTFIQVFLPLSMASLNVSLFLIVFMALLVSLLVGFLLILLNFSYIYEYIFTHILLVFEKGYIKKLTLMNLVSHRMRNRTTVLVYAVSLTFIIFLYVNLILQREANENARLRAAGSEDILYKGIRSRDWHNMIKNYNLSEKLTWTARSSSLEKMKSLNISELSKTNVGNLVSSYNGRVYAVSPNYMDFTPEGYSSISEKGIYKDTSLSLTEFMYTRFAGNGAIIGESVRDYLGVNCSSRKDVFQLNRKYSENNYLLNSSTCIAGMERLPGANMTSRPGFTTSDVVYPYPVLLSLFDKEKISYSDITNYSKIHFKPKEGVLASTLNNLLAQDAGILGYQIFSFDQFKAQFKSTNKLMDLVFMIVTFLALTMSLFSLISTVAANVVEQSKELAIFRCLGLGRFTISRIFLYEAIIIILNGAFIGLCVGVSLGTVIAYQNAMFTNTVARVIFPWSLLWIILIFSLISSIVAALLPVFNFLRQSIVKIIKHID